MDWIESLSAGVDFLGREELGVVESPQGAAKNEPVAEDRGPGYIRIRVGRVLDSHGDHLGVLEGAVSAFTPQPANYQHKGNGLLVYASPFDGGWSVYHCDDALDKAGEFIACVSDGEFARLFFPLKKKSPVE